MKTPSVDELAARFEYLDDLRESGKTNMFGAGPYVKRAFKIEDSEEVKFTVVSWMKTFKDGKLSPDDRAAAALAKEENR